MMLGCVVSHVCVCSRSLKRGLAMKKLSWYAISGTQGFSAGMNGKAVFSAHLVCWCVDG